MQLGDLATKVISYVENFEVIPGKTWLTNLCYPIGGAIVYVLVVLGGQAYLRTQKDDKGKPLPGLKLKWVNAIHNAILCVWSLLMFLGVAHGFYYLYKALGFPVIESCVDPSAPNDTYTRGPLVFWEYIYYLSKYWEFIDTFILVLKKRELIFLHVWHHAVMPLTSLFWVISGYPCAYVPSGLNSFIHVIMYAYYAASALGFYSPIRKYITSMQIAQFLTGLGHCSAWLWHIYVEGRSCTGDIPMMLFTYAVCLTFLGLFIRFFIIEYIEQGRIRGGKGKEEGEAGKKEGAEGKTPVVSETKSHDQ